ncbi:MAG: hypothetical protein RLZZ337_999 [Bacteroidota bacterium]
MRILFSLFLCIAVLIVRAQILDTSDVHVYKPIEVSTTSELDYLKIKTDSTSVDTSILDFQNNYKAYTDNFPFLDLGLEGSPIMSLSASNNRNHGFVLGLTNQAFYFFDDSIRIYQTARPFTRLNYSQGQKELINIGATHAQQLSKRLAFGLDYHRLKNQNFYYSNIVNGDRVRMNNLFNLKLYTNYLSKDRRYEMLASYLWNKSINVEAGGLKSDSFFNTLSGINKIENNPAKYSEAFGSQIQRKLTLIQYFRPQKTIKDTGQIYNLNRFNNQFYLKSSLEFYNVSFTDDAPDSINYGFSLAAFKDSVHHRAINNEFGYSVKLKQFNLAVGLLYSLNSIKMNQVSDQFNNIHLTSMGSVAIKNINIKAQAQFGVLGYNLGDYKINGVASTQWRNFNVNAGILSQLAEPFYLEQNLASSVINWNKNFGKTSINQLFASAGLSGNNQNFNLSLLSETSYNLIYYDTDLQVKQWNDFISIIKLKGAYSFSTTRFGGRTNVLLQQVSNATILPRPPLSADIDLHGKFNLFSKKLGVQLGSKLFWFSKFNSPMYNPYTRQWHLTNQSFEMYPPISVYANAKLKSFCFGIEFFHVQMQLMGDSYYSSPAYPLMPRVMRLNVRWDLSN